MKAKALLTVIAMVELGAALVSGLAGVGLWPVVAMHLAIATWLGLCLRSGSGSVQAKAAARME